MRQSKAVFILVIIMALLSVSTPVFAVATGGLRIDPDQTVATLETPATFEVSAQSADSYDVNFLLVVTVECYVGMPGGPAIAAEVAYGGTTIEFTKSDFVEASSGFVPPTGTTPGARYTVASLKDHIDTEGSVYWAMKPMGHADFDPLTTTEREITVTLDSSDPRMLVYLQGKSVNDATLFDMKVPPTTPGFVIPEIPLGTIMVLASMIAALAIYAKKPSFAVLK
ncbi:MAG: hypothetical protein ACYS5F_10915 [Planctomycetota bacterium]|jgi:hypothetical protein